MAPLRIFSSSCWYPLVRNRSAVSNRSGVLTSPSRFGSSPSRVSTFLTKSAMLSPPAVSGTKISLVSLINTPHCRAVPRLQNGLCVDKRSAPFKSLKSIVYLKTVVARLFDAHPFDFRLGERAQPAENLLRQHLGGRHLF